jgi:hypothetical protein
MSSIAPPHAEMKPMGDELGSSDDRLGNPIPNTDPNSPDYPQAIVLCL